MRCKFQLAYKGSALAPNAHVAPRRTHIHNCKCCLPVVGLPIRCFFSSSSSSSCFFFSAYFVYFVYSLLVTHTLAGSRYRMCVSRGHSPYRLACIRSTLFHAHNVGPFGFRLHYYAFISLCYGLYYRCSLAC